jgi:hypothetical protein
MEHARHEADQVFADADKPFAPAAQFLFAEVAASVEVALAWRVCGVEALVVFVATAGEASANRPQAATQWPERAMGLQAAGAVNAFVVAPPCAMVPRRFCLRYLIESMRSWGNYRALNMRTL